MGTDIAHGVRMMPELFVFKLCTALIFNCAAKGLPKNRQTVKDANFFHSHGGATYTHKHRLHGATVRVDSQRATSDGAEH